MGADDGGRRGMPDASSRNCPNCGILALPNREHCSDYCFKESMRKRISAEAKARAELRKRFAKCMYGVEIGGAYRRAWAHPREGATVSLLLPARTPVVPQPLIHRALRRRATFTQKAVPMSWLRRVCGSPDWQGRTDMRAHLVGGCAYDLRLVARALACAPPCTTVRVESAPYDGELSVLRIHGDRWTAMIACLRHPQGAKLEFPEAQ